MSRIKLNILANFAGQGWFALITLALVPLYIRLLGIEAYGLIGFYVMLQSLLVALELGLGQTLNRELARYSAQPEKTSEARDLVRTLETGYWAMGIVIGIAVAIASPLIADHWIKTETIPHSVIQKTAMIMGIVIAFQWPIGFYQGGLMGLQRQVALNGIRIGMSTLNGGGAVLILWLVSPTILAFFAWQIVVVAVEVALTAIFLWRCLPPSNRPARFDPRLLRNIWRFAAGMSGINLSALILMQLDKVILSKLLSLEMFGYYTLAGVVANGLMVIINPIFTALFPQFSALAAGNNVAALKQLYHRGTQLMATLVLPVAMVLAFFSFDLLQMWTGSIEVPRHASPIVSILVIGTALNGLMTLPYALQLAYGWTSIGLRINTFFIITLVPAIIFMTTHYGSVGAASVWTALNGIYILIGAWLTHQRLLKGETWRWFVEDISPPLVGTLLIVGVGRWLTISPMSLMATFSALSLILFSALAAAGLASPQIRTWLLITLFKSRVARV